MPNLLVVLGELAKVKLLWNASEFFKAMPENGLRQALVAALVYINHITDVTAEECA